jgi:hypothetical protein
MQNIGDHHHQQNLRTKLLINLLSIILTPLHGRQNGAVCSFHLNSAELNGGSVTADHLTAIFITASVNASGNLTAIFAYRLIASGREAMTINQMYKRLNESSDRLGS